MENAVDALKLAFGVLVFVIALTVIMTMFTQARETSDLVLQRSDITEFMDYTEQSQIVGGITLSGEERVVGLETIIPTLYKYYKENYTVVFLNSNGSPLEIYETQTRYDLWSGYGTDNGYTNRYYNDNYSTSVCAFDVDDETRRREPWVGSNEKFKENLDHFLQGGEYTYGVSWASGGQVTYDYGDGFIKNYDDKQFRENLGEYTYNGTSTGDLTGETNTSTGTKEKKKRVIVYTLIG